MGDLKVTGYGAEYSDNGITAVKLDTFGRNSGTTMFWCDYTEDTTTWYGWYDNDWEQDLNSTSLAPGEGVWFKSPSAEYKVISSGQVNSETVSVTLVAGSQLCPNTTPVTLKMNAAYVAGYGEEYSDNGITAVKLDSFGRNSGATMFWCDYTEDNTTWYGWYDNDWESELGESVTLAPGESVWLKSPTAGWTINWPSPLAND